MMTKSLAQEQGRIAGQVALQNAFTGTFLQKSRSEVLELARSAAAVKQSDVTTGKSPHAEELRRLFYEAYVSEFMKHWEVKYNEQPDVKAARRLESSTRTLNEQEQRALEAL